MSRGDFTAAYDGEALKDHRIDVRDLAPALLAFGQLFEEANGLLNGDRARVRVQVRATGKGSFEINLEVVQSLASQLEGFLTSHPVSAAANLITVVTGLFVLVKWMRGKKPKRLSESGAGIVLEIDGVQMTVSHSVVKLAESIAVRAELEKVLDPLRSDGIDWFQMRDGAIPSVEVTRDELAWFRAPDGDVTEELPERKITAAYSIVSLAFKADNKWRLTDGQSVISATISDAAFLAKVDRDQPFSKGDVLVCEVTVQQAHTSDGVRTTYEVTRVLEHRLAPRQTRLF